MPARSASQGGAAGVGHSGWLVNAVAGCTGVARLQGSELDLTTSALPFSKRAAGTAIAATDRRPASVPPSRLAPESRLYL